MLQDAQTCRADGQRRTLARARLIAAAHGFENEKYNDSVFKITLICSDKLCHRPCSVHSATGVGDVSLREVLPSHILMHENGHNGRENFHHVTKNVYTHS